MPTYDEMRSNAERIFDASLKERVLRGIAVMRETLGPDCDIDPDELLMESPTQCVLGQTFDTHTPTEEEWNALRVHWPHLTSRWADTPMIARPGYLKGLAIIDGDVLAEPGAFGFDTQDEEYDDLTEAWLIALGEDEGDS